MEPVGVTYPDKLNNKVHAALAHSYFNHFLFLLAGVILDLVFQVKIFQGQTVITIGFVILILATALIFWAQRSTRDLHKNWSLDKEEFLRGPYRYLRTPTHLGVFLLTFGFGIVVNAFFITLTSALSFFIGKIIFLRKYEKTLAEKYGQSYLEYKKEVTL